MGNFDESKVNRNHGKFAPKNTGSFDGDIDSTPSLQTDQPLERLGMSTANKQLTGWTGEFERENTLVDPPYQRGSVWNDEQRRALMNSLMRGIPCGAIITNDRLNPSWRERNGELGTDEPFRAVVDGRQRLETVYAWHDGELDLPASWFDPDHIESTHETDDGPYVYRDELTTSGRRLTDNRCHLPESCAQLSSIEEEARLFRLVNGGGVAQTSETMAHAQSFETS